MDFYWEKYKKRNMEILKLRQQGFLLREIADKYNLKKERVRQICLKMSRHEDLIFLMPTLKAIRSCMEKIRLLQINK